MSAITFFAAKKLIPLTLSFQWKELIGASILIFLKFGLIILGWFTVFLHMASTKNVIKWGSLSQNASSKNRTVGLCNSYSERSATA